MKNRDLSVNTFEGGLDLDTDKRLVKSNRLVKSENIDITKRGDSMVVKDLDGEDVLFEFEDVSTLSVQTLSAVTANFLVDPTSTTRQAIVVFYVRSDLKFIVRALYLDNNSSEVILQEDLSQEDYDFLKDSSVDVEKVGKFGYDVLYFVDNRRQPRKIDCVTYVTNVNEMTLTFNSEVDGVGYKQIILNLNSSQLPQDAHRCYVYAYKTGGPLVYTPVNPSTDTIKFLEVNYSGSQQILFDIYPEDYGNYTFQIVYHKEGSVVYRNFIIGNPFKVEIAVGALNNFIIGLRSPQDQPETTQVPSWEFLYNGNSFVGYIDTPTVELGTTKVYLSETVAPEFLVPDGYYQRADVFNTYFRVQAGVITEQTINNGDVVWSVVPSSIEADVRAAASFIEEGNNNRLQGITIHVPQTLNVGGVNYTFVNTIANNQLGRVKISQSNNYTYTLEYPQDLAPVTNYSPENVTLEAFIISILRDGPGYNVTARGVLTSPVSENMDVQIRVQAIDVASQNILPPAIVSFTIISGQNSGEATVYHNENFGGDVDYGPACILSSIYLGPEQITIANAC